MMIESSRRDWTIPMQMVCIDRYTRITTPVCFVLQATPQCFVLPEPRRQSRGGLEHLPLNLMAGWTAICSAMSPFDSAALYFSKAASHTQTDKQDFNNNKRKPTTYVR